jgi:hypothetical protein
MPHFMSDICNTVYQVQPEPESEPTAEARAAEGTIPYIALLAGFFYPICKRMISIFLVGSRIGFFFFNLFYFGLSFTIIYGTGTGIGTLACFVYIEICKLFSIISKIHIRQSLIAGNNHYFKLHQTDRHDVAQEALVGLLYYFYFPLMNVQI